MLPHNGYTSQPVVELYNPSPKSWRFSGEKNGSSSGKTAVSALICQRLNCGFFIFCEKIVTPFLTLANNKRSLPTISTTPDRLPNQRVRVQIFPDYLGSNFAKKQCFQMVPTLVLIYTPKEAHSQIFVTGGSVIA